jgi:hypothetical protein
MAKAPPGKGTKIAEGTGTKGAKGAGTKESVPPPAQTKKK